MRVAYLGPAGTFSEDALRAAAGNAAIEQLPAPTIFDAIVAVDEGRADRALVPFENSLEGTGTINRIDAGGSTEVTIIFEAEPETGVPLTLQVEVLPVIGETLFDNNVATYTVAFD